MQCVTNMNSKKWLTFIVLIVLFTIGALIANYGFLENIIIPDICYYHNNDYQTTALFDLFYHFPGQEGGHPAPTWFNFITTLIIGSLVGWLLARLLTKRKPNKTIS